MYCDGARDTIRKKTKLDNHFFFISCFLSPLLQAQSPPVFLAMERPHLLPRPDVFSHRLDSVVPQLNLRGDLSWSLNFPNALP